jgi:hypothetical protein
MSLYRIYPLDRAGRVGSPMDAEFDDDREAVLYARGLGEKVRDGCEVWRLTHFVGRFHFQPSPEPA